MTGVRYLGRNILKKCDHMYRVSIPFLGDINLSYQNKNWQKYFWWYALKIDIKSFQVTPIFRGAAIGPHVISTFNMEVNTKVVEILQITSD